MSQALFKLLATDYADSRQAPIQWAERLADAAESPLKDGSRIEISLRGLRGFSSSYFNALFVRLLTFATKQQIKAQIDFVTETSVQKQLLDRSQAAVLEQPNEARGAA